LNRTLNSGYKLIYRFKISFFVFYLIEIECEFDYIIIGNKPMGLFPSKHYKVFIKSSLTEFELLETGKLL
jgi:hypothetical protein